MGTSNLAEQAYLIGRSINRTLSFATAAILVAIIFEVIVLGVIISAHSEFSRHGRIEQVNNNFFLYRFIPNDPADGPSELANFAVTFIRVALNNIVIALGGTVFVAAMLIFRTRRELTGLKDWQNNYLGQAYLSHLELDAPTGNSSLAVVLQSCAKIFPQVRFSRDYESLSAEMSEKGIAPSFTKDSNGISLDVVLKTKEGGFILKHFGDKAVSISDIIQVLKVANKLTGNRIFRIVCIAKEYDRSFTDPEEGAIPTKLNQVPIDLVYERNGTYIAVWIT